MKHAYLLLTLLFLTPLISQAADFTVSPLLFDHTLEQRSIITETITITNNSTYQVAELYAAVNEITVGAGGEIKEFIPPSMSNRATSVTSWIEFSRASIKLQPGETHELPVTIRINPKAEPGSYHAYIGIAGGPNRDEAERLMRQGQGQGVLVKISLDEKRNDFLRLANFFIDRFIINEDNNALRYEITNPSDKPVVPAGEVIFYDARGREVAATPVNPAQQSIEPGKTIMFEGAVPMNDRVGRHKAFLSVEYGENQLASVHDTTFFYMIPLKQLLIIFCGVLFVAIIVAVIIHRRYGGDDDESDDDAGYVPMYERTGSASPAQDHDIDLRKTDQ